MAHALEPWEPLIRGHPDHRVQDVLFLVPRAHHRGIEGHVTFIPHVRNTFDKSDSDVAVAVGGLRVPRLLKSGPLHRGFIRQHRCFAWRNHINVITDDIETLLATAWTVYYNFVLCRPFSHRLVGERGRSEPMLYRSLLP